MILSIILHIDSDYSVDSPGRFLAAAEIKAMLSYILLNYDFKFPDGLYEPGHVPPETWFGTVSAPSSKIELLFRRRESPI